LRLVPFVITLGFLGALFGGGSQTREAAEGSQAR
jgi:hypothetical protein